MDQTSKGRFSLSLSVIFSLSASEISTFKLETPCVTRWPMDRDGRSYRARGHAGVPVIAATGWKTGWNREKRDMVSLGGGWLVSINVLSSPPLRILVCRSVLSIVLLFSTSLPPLSLHNNFDGQPCVIAFFDAKQAFSKTSILSRRFPDNSVFAFLFSLSFFLLFPRFLFFFFYFENGILESTDRWIILTIKIILLSLNFSNKNLKLWSFKEINSYIYLT